MKHRRYRLGIDVGLNSVGFAAIEVDEEDVPLKLLNAQSVIHDGGVDPQSNKTGDTRKKQSGIARRTRRMRRRRRARLERLDCTLEKLGFPIIDPDSLTDPFEEWNVRAELATAYIPDDERRKEDISIAVRHIARHRGWRNPYRLVESLLVSNEFSENYRELKNRVEDRIGVPCPEGLTPAQLIARVLDSGFTEAPRLRTRTAQGEKDIIGLLPTKLMQEDNANELKRIFAVQRVDEFTANELLKKVFASETPRGAAARLVGKDPLDHAQRRAIKASLAFQRYRIVNVITNIRIQDGNVLRPLTVPEKQTVFDNLSTESSEDITWSDIADLLNVKRSQIKGIGSLTEDGADRVSSKPPRMNSLQVIATCKDKTLRKQLQDWWKKQTDEAHEAMLCLLSNAEDIDKVRDNPAYAEAIEFIDGLDDESLTKLDSIDLPAGRAAYSAKTLRVLTERMLTSDDDLHEARKHVFGVDDNWRPPVSRIDEPTGNPAVDRVLKITNRYLMSCRKRWGEPEVVQIEHVRDAFSSVATQRGNKREYERNNAKRTEYRIALAKQLRLDKQVDKVRESDLRRQEAIQRQNGQCLYCGDDITFATCEMDHIVPRKGAGSTNTRTNFAAVCAECNRMKSKKPFSVWAREEAARQKGVDAQEAEQRVRAFIFPPGSYPLAAQRRFKQAVIGRLRQSEADDPIDNRSIESVAWMADELHRRIDWFFNADRYSAGDMLASATNGVNTKVWVFQGRLTAAARKASHIEGDIHFIGMQYKTRLDRRHHAVDAAVIAMMNHAVAQTLAERNSLRESQQLIGRVPSGEVVWKEYPAAGSPHYEAYQRWLKAMEQLLKLLNEALDHDRVRVLRWRRLSLGDSIAHDATIHKLDNRLLGSAIDADTIRKSSMPALYCALTQLPDYDAKQGLLENPSRSIVVHGKHYGANDQIGFFASPAAQISVQGGSADIGSAIHHVRIYKCWKNDAKGNKKFFYGMIRVFQADLMRYRHVNLFTCPLPEQSVSMRYGDSKTVQAVNNGTAKYLGSLSVGDILRIDLSAAPVSGQIKEFYQYFAQRDLTQGKLSCNTWVVDGFFNKSTLRLHPHLLAAEGLNNIAALNQKPIPEAVDKIVSGQGWLPAVNALSAYSPQCLRFNTLGECRWESRSGLPTSWRWS